jgi:prevent-host-death family protein
MPRVEFLKKVDIAKANGTLADYAQNLQQGPLVVTKKGKPVAVLVPVEGMDWESLSVSTSPEFLDLIERSRRRQEQEGSLSSEEVRRHLGLPPRTEAKAKPKSRKAKPKSQAK